jgi:hypothetical protein
MKINRFKKRLKPFGMFALAFVLLGGIFARAEPDQGAEGGSVQMTATAASLKPAAVFAADSAISLEWVGVDEPGLTGYNLYQREYRWPSWEGSVQYSEHKVNESPILEPRYTVIGLMPNTYYGFSVAAVINGVEGARSDITEACTKSGSVTGRLLPSGEGRTLHMEFADMALNMEFAGLVMSDPNRYFWCLSPIWEDEDDPDNTRVHIFMSSWPTRPDVDTGFYGPMGDWKVKCEIVHIIGDTPEGPFDFCDKKGGTCGGFAVTNDDVEQFGQFAPHNVKVKKIDGVYCLLYITQGGPRNAQGVGHNQKHQTTNLATSKSLCGPWEFQGDNKDGVVVRASTDPNHWTYDSILGTDNPDIIKIDGQYVIYYKAGVSFGAMRYGYAISDSLYGGYVMSDSGITDNIDYFEDTTAFEWNGKIYLLTTDNNGGNTGIRGAGILWESQDRGRSFKRADAQIGYGVLQDYLAIPPGSTRPYIGYPKFERPAVLFAKDGSRPAYFYAASGRNIDGHISAANYVLRINDAPPQIPAKGFVTFDAGGGTGNMPAAEVIFGTTMKLPPNAFTRSGFVFDGWAASGGASGIVQNEGRLKYILGDVVLAAQWRAE